LKFTVLEALWIIERKKKQKVSEIILEGIRKLLIGKGIVISIRGGSLIGPNA
jgi:hypothetical protein